MVLGGRVQGKSDTLLLEKVDRSTPELLFDAVRLATALSAATCSLACHCLCATVHCLCATASLAWCGLSAATSSLACCNLFTCLFTCMQLPFCGLFTCIVRPFLDWSLPCLGRSLPFVLGLPLCIFSAATRTMLSRLGLQASVGMPKQYEVKRGGKKLQLTVVKHRLLPCVCHCLRG